MSTRKKIFIKSGRVSTVRLFGFQFRYYQMFLIPLSTRCISLEIS